MTYIYRHKPIVFNGGPVISPPQRKKGVEIDEWDKVFESEEEFRVWYKDLVVGLATLDEVMNYCEYFKRIKGNIGYYERSGKKFPVDGTWTGYEINTEMMRGFKEFLIENGWLNNWWKLMKRYESKNNA